MQDPEMDVGKQGHMRKIDPGANRRGALISLAACVVLPIRLVKASVDLFRPEVYPNLEDDI
jgi:hypothetical protein